MLYNIQSKLVLIISTSSVFNVV